MAETAVHTSKNEEPEAKRFRGRGRPRCEQSHKRILDAALECLEQFGFTNATTDVIAERAGASKATIYRWWPNKAALLAEALREAVAQELPFPHTGNLKDDLQLQLGNFIRLLTGPRGRVFKSLIAAAQNDAEVAAAFTSVWVAPRREEAKKVLTRYRRDGQLPPDADLDLLLDLVYGALYFRLLSGYGALTPDLAHSITKLALSGVLNRTRK
jgi:AcrR family transcriptional regulator